MAQRWLDQAQLHHLLQQRLQRKALASPPRVALTPTPRKVNPTPPRKLDTTPPTADLTPSNYIAFPDHLVLFHPRGRLKDHRGLAILIQIVLPTHLPQHLVADRTLLRRSQKQSNRQQQQKSKSK